MKAKHQRFVFIVISLAILSGAMALILNNFQENLLFFYTPTDIKNKPELGDKLIRVGGMVKEGSVVTNDLELRFILTDYENEIIIKYQGIIPGLFRENQGMVAKGMHDIDGHFEAVELLAKHDENYMPPEVKNSLKNKKEAQ